MLKLENVKKVYDGVTILENISLEIEEGEIISILGPSGCGKTTLLNLILGIADADGGRILYNGEDITEVPMEKRGFNIVFQDYALFPNLTAHALAEPEYLPYCESLMAFCRENGIPCYNFQYVKADYMENLDAYYYDLYHLNGEGADKFSAFFARFFNAYVGGEDVDGWFYADSAEYLASVDRVTNAWLMRRGDQFVADCNRGTQVTPLYRFCLSTDGVRTLLRDYSEDNALPVSAVPAGSSVFVYAVPAGQPDAEPVFDMIWSSELGAYGT